MVGDDGKRMTISKEHAIPGSTNKPAKLENKQSEARADDKAKKANQPPPYVSSAMLSWK